MPNSASGFELRDHTADIALYVWGRTLEELFCAAARGLYATIGELKASKECHNMTLSLQAGDAEFLLRDFLAELHFRFETDGLVVTQFAFDRLDERELRVTTTGAEVDRDESVFDREVKAVTSHDVRITRGDGRYEVTLILDI